MTKRTFTRFLIIISLLSLPLIVSAQSAGTGSGAGSQAIAGFTTLGNIVNAFTNSIVKALATLFASLAMVAFFYGIVKYIWGVRSGDAKTIKDGNQFMFWGLVALFVMFSVWGIILFFQNVFGITNKAVTIPGVTIEGAGSSGGYSYTGNSQNTGYTYTPNGTASGGTIVYGPNNSVIGKVNSSGQIVNSAGQIVGRMVNGTPVNNSGAPISEASAVTTNSATVKGCDTDNYTLAQCQSNCTGTWDPNTSSCVTGSASNGNGTAVNCDTDNYTLAECQSRCTGTWDPNTSSCVTGSYSGGSGCTPGYDCSLSDGSTGMCNSSGTCVSNTDYYDTGTTGSTGDNSDTGTTDSTGDNYDTGTTDSTGDSTSDSTGDWGPF